MAVLDYYTIQLKNLHKRYKLTQSVLNLFKALDDYRSGIDPDALPRLIRISPGMRKACTDTISQLAKVMQNKQDSSSVADCTELIQNCTEILALANESTTNKRFPFMKLPLEVRRCVYKHYIQGLFSGCGPHNVIISKKGTIGCHCPPPEARKMAFPIKLQLAFTSTVIKNEFLSTWFDELLFHFTCACELKHHLSNNSNLRANIKQVKVHWTGPQAAEAFKLLKQVSSLKTLILTISKSTTNHLSEREQRLQRYFSHRGPVRLTDALGFDELRDLKGISDIHVDHVDKAQAYRRTNEERHNLEFFLVDQVRP